MFTVTEPNLLLRVPGKLPKGLKLRTEEFQKGWDLAPSVDTRRLQKEIHPGRWYFVKTADGGPAGRVFCSERRTVSYSVVSADGSTPYS